MKHCKRCGQNISDSLIRKRSRIRGSNIRNGLMKRQKQGFRIGRPKIRDDREIWQLRKDGLTMKEISEALCISKGSVQASLRGKKP